MTLAFAVTFAESAVRHLEDLREWYEKQGVPEVGARLVAEVIEASEHLAESPQSGRVVPEFGTTWLRELVRPPFRIVYRVDENCARVVRVWRSERMMQELQGNA
ncbi:MAG: type II toxin-antitoxin system RelE/ParE family toxin [Thermoleophilia bacterium]|nr:type II toxin-antitoxin system RelE/ParE family toxin [Thermoleophilia bacterium]